MPKLSAVTHAIRRRVQMVPFRAVFEPVPGQDMRERLKAEAGGAILAWIIEGAPAWRDDRDVTAQGRNRTDRRLPSGQDVFGQWLEERCERVASASERSSDLHKDYKAWSESQGLPPKSNMMLSGELLSAGFE